MWLDDIPSTWEESKIIHFARLLTGGTPDRQNPDFWENGHIPWLASGEVNQGLISRPTAFITEAALHSSNAKLLPVRSVVIALAGQGKTKGMVARLGIEATCNQSLAAFVSDERRLDSNYLYYYLASNYRNIRALVGDDLRDGLSLGHLSFLRTPLPPIAEQRVIANFLERKTAAIDALIVKKERLIELLQEKRQALITQAVTKGLNPSAPLKSSQIGGAELIPAHWSVMPLKRALNRIEQGWSPEGEGRVADDSEWGVLKSGCVNEGVFVETENKALPSSVQPRHDLEVRPGDLLMSRASGSPRLIGSVALVPSCRTHLMISDKLYRLNPNADVAIPEFLAIALSAHIARQQIESFIRGAEGLANNISQSDVKRLIIPFPPIAEQVEVVELVTRETTSLDAVARNIRLSTLALREFRQAMISAAVIGKIDIRAEDVA